MGFRYLGRKPFVPDSRDFTLYPLSAAAPLPEPPERFGHGSLYRNWGMLGNDIAGNCVFADAGHQTMLVNRLAGHPVVITATNALSDYADVTGYDPNDPDTDQGTEIREALKFRRATGTIDNHGKRHRIGAYVSFNPGDFDELMRATYVFTAVSIGFAFPSTAWDQFDKRKAWDVVDADAPIEGGHDVPIVGRSSANVAGCISWGRRVGMTRRFYERYCSPAFGGEAWAIIFPEEFRNGKTARGYDLAALTSMLAHLP